MKHFFTLCAAMLLFFSLQAQTHKTMVWGDSTRQYLEYVPASYNANTPAPVLFVLHGLGDDMTNMFNATGFKRIADQHGWIVVTPQATEAVVSVPMLGNTSLGTAWNSGVSGDIPIVGHIVVNEQVDDAGFLMAILTDLINHYNVDQENVFCTGFSMGGFMSNRMAIEHADKFKAIASVSGTIGNEVSNGTPSRHISTMHFHGTADQMVTYENAELSYSGISFTIGLGAEATVNFWKTANACAATPTTTTFPDNASDNLTFEKYLYENANDGTQTVFIKVNGGEHTWYSTPTNDIDYTTEIYNFFATQMGIVSVNDHVSTAVSVYPNPAADLLRVAGEGISLVRIYDATGHLMTSTQETEVNVSSWAEGMYFVSVSTENGQLSNYKIMIAR
ncbi:MAG: prolyl oligopeptidase family serine peptidase [Bacteroidales bacterium]|nr:prolyl oligopeptidase family serine peptidase [Bacteroidales bacterium]